MPSEIFCPKEHLILDARRCPICDWERPLPQDVGSIAWGPVGLPGGLGGPGAGVFAVPAVAQHVVVLPQRNGELAALDTVSGEIIWQTALDAGRMIREVVADEARFLASISDERPLGQAGNGRLVAVEASDGEIQTLWQADSHQISAPALAARHILVRTSKTGLFALSRSPQPEQLWQQPLDAWWALTPFVAGDTVLVSDGRPMHGEGYLVAFSIGRGQKLWKLPTDGMLAQSPAACGAVMAFLEARRRIVAVDIHSGERLWVQEHRKIYCPPQADGSHFYLIVRGEASSPEDGRYQLRALHPQDGSPVWQTALPARARLLCVGRHALYATTDDGRLLAFESDQGKFLWQATLSSDEDPIRSELRLDETNLIAGTYEGKVFAIRADAALDAETGDDDRSRAILLALQADFRPAADIFADKLHEYEKAFALYERGEHYQQAGDLASALNMNARARDYYDKAGNQEAAIEALIQNGDLLEAAQRFESNGKLMQAAKLYEEVGDLRRSLEVYKRLKNWAKVFQLWLSTTPAMEDIHDFEEAGLDKEAGLAANKLGMFSKASKMFRKSDEHHLELEALQNLVKEKPEGWAWERIAELARSQGRFFLEAQAWEALKRPLKAATAYHRSAQQAERVSPDAEADIAERYEKARRIYDELGMDAECLDCTAKIIHFRSLPQIIIDGFARNAFREGEFNLLKLTVRNIGRGVAKNVRIQIPDGRFEVDETTSIVQLNNIAARGERPAKIPLRPYEHQIGEAVPLVVEWMWQDHQDENYREKSTTYVIVKAKESASTSQPQEYHFHGPVTQYQGENLEVIGGDKIGGDRVEGDKVEGQKGDSVAIHRGEGVRLVGERLGTVDIPEGPGCPNCYLPISEEDKFCQGCGYVLKTEEKS